MNGRYRKQGPLIGALLRMALIHGVVDVVATHVERGGDPGITDASGQSALMLAAAGGHPGICRILLEAGADPVWRDHAGRDALSLAVQKGHSAVAALLQAYVNPESCDDAAQAVDIARCGDVPVAFCLSAGDWEEDTADILPSPDELSLAAARAVQDRISCHIPADPDTEWSDISIDLPRRSLRRGGQRTRNEPSGQEDTGRARLSVAEAADEITAKNGAPATIADLMLHPATRGMRYAAVKFLYLKWKSRTAQADVSYEWPLPPQSKVDRPADPDSAPVLTAAVISVHSSVTHTSPPAGSPRPPLTTSAQRIWAAADQISAQNGAPATLFELMAHPATKRHVYTYIKKEYVLWSAFNSTRASAARAALSEVQPVEVQERAARQASASPG